MNSIFKYAFIAISVMVLSSCASRNVGIQKHTGFTELPFPSNTYQPGQIVEIYSSPRKVEVTFDPQIPWDQASTSEGWDISADEASNIKSKLATEINKIIEANTSVNSTYQVSVEFTETKTRLIPKNRIFKALDEAIQKDSSLKRLLDMYMDDGTRFDVITQTLNATISFKVLSSSGQVLNLDSEVIEKLSSDFDIEFSRQAGSNSIISGSNLTVGIHYDPKMIALLVK
ncbi:conserved exported hypothetical protein [Alteromonas macleodii]